MTQPAVVPDPTAQIAGLIFAVLLVSHDGRIVEANAAAEDMLDCSARRLIGRRLVDVVEIGDERVRDNLEATEVQMIARGVSLVTRQRDRRVNLTSSPLHSDPGWRVVTLSDVGQGDSRGDDNDRYELRAPAVLAHEIKNPLSAIRGASQLLARRVDERDKPLARMISAEVDRIAALIDRMQQLGSKPVAVVGSCNLHEAIRNAMATVRAGRDEGCEMAEEFDPSLPPVAADQVALEQVLINLLSNACDANATSPGARVTVQTRFVSGLVFSSIRFGKTTRLPIEITVTDQGPGIDEAIRDHVFEPFVSSKPQGQGLGLALVRKLIRDMGGSITHERDERAGLTHFRINLPVAG